MGGFDLGKLITDVAGKGLENGFRQGIKYLQEDKQLTVWAIRTHNQAVLDDIAHVDALFLQESVGLVLNPMGLMGDPTAGSRHALQQVFDKYGKDCEAYWASLKK